MIKVETISSHQKRRFQLGVSQSSALCTSLRSSRLNLASVASELEFNQENASLDSIEISNNGAATSNTLFNRQTFGQKPTSGGLVKNLNRLLEKHVKMMDNMTMEDFGFQQRVL